MTTLNGNRPASPLSKTVSARLSDDLGRLTVDYWQTPRFSDHPTHTKEMRPFVRTFASAYPYNLPVDAGFETKTAMQAKGYKFDLYYRVHIKPRILDYGNLINTEVKDLEIWNAFFEPVWLSNSGAPTQPGIELGNPDGVSIPYTVKPNELTVFKVTAFLSGPPSIDGKFTLTIDGVVYEISAIGRRILLWPFPPNWKSPFDDSYVFKSWAMRSADGHVQSGSQWGNNPRREIEYNVLLTRDDAGRADNMLFAWQSRFYGVIFWPDETKLTAPVAIGDVFLPCDTTDRAFAQGGFVTVYDSTTSYESAEVLAVATNGVTVNSPMRAAWPAGVRVYPVFAAAINPQISGSRHTDGLIEMPVQFECDPSTTPGNTATGGSTPTYRGEELYLGALNWSSALPFQFNSDRQKIDYNTGKFGLYSGSGFSPLQKEHNWMFKTRAEAQAFRAWLGRREGVARPVYIPTGTTDLTLIANPVFNGQTIDVVDTEYGALLVGHPARRDIIVVMRDGTYYTRRVTSSQDIPGGTRLFLDQVWPAAIDRAKVKRISFLGLFRQVSNKATIRWLTTTKGTASLSLVTDRND